MRTSDAAATGNHPSATVAGPRRPARPEETVIDARRPVGTRHENAVLSLLRIPVLRRMWAAITLSSLGDWLGLLANTALAQQLTSDRSVAAQGVAISGVILTRLLPDLVLGPLAGALADRLDRRRTIIIGDVLAGLLFLSIALFYDLTWLYVGQFFIEAVGLFTMPAKQAVWVNIVPREKLPVANQMSLISVYGAVPVAAVIFALLSTANRLVQDPLLGSERIPIVAALVLNAVSFFIGAGTVYVSRHDIPSFLAGGGDTDNVFAAIREGVVFIRRSAVLRGLYIGILGAFLAGGVVVGVAQLYVLTLDAGTAGYSILFGTVFTGLAVGMVVGPKILPTISRRRLFGLAISASGVTMVAMSLLADFVLVVALALLVGIFGGIAWINGYTMIGYEVEDRLRGRVFAFVMSSVRVTLLVAVAVGPLFAGWVGTHSVKFREVELRFTGPGVTLLLAGLLAAAVGVYVSRQLGGGGARRLLDLLWATVSRPDLLAAGRVESGLFVVIDGNGADALVGEQGARLSTTLRADGYPVVLTGEPAQTAAGGRLAAVLSAGEPIAPQTEALLRLADRAEHVARVVRPALTAHQVVICRRYTDSALARLGADLGLDRGRLGRTSQWSTGDLAPELTIVLDGPAEFDRDGVRALFLELADSDPVHYVLLPADLDADSMAAAILSRVQGLLASRSERVARIVPTSDAPGPVAAAG